MRKIVIGNAHFFTYVTAAAKVYFFSSERGICVYRKILLAACSYKIACKNLHKDQCREGDSLREIECGSKGAGLVCRVVRVRVLCKWSTA